MNMKKLVAEAAIVGALGFGAMGLGTGLANAYTPVSGNTPSVQWHQDDGGWCWWWWCGRPWHGWHGR